MEKIKVQDRSKDKLKSLLKDSITNLFGNILDYTEIALGDKNRYTALRSKILRLSNDCIRDLQRELDVKYDIKFVPTTDDVVVINKK